MITRTLQFSSFAFANSADQTKNDHTSSIVTFNDYLSELFLKPDDAGNPAWSFYRISGLSFKIYVQKIIDNAYGLGLTFGIMDKAFNTNTLTYANKPSRSTASYSANFSTTGYVEIQKKNVDYQDRQIFEKGVSTKSSYGKYAVYTPSGNFNPQLILTLDESDVVGLNPFYWDEVYGESNPATWNAASALHMTVFTRPNGLCYGDVKQTGITVIWREYGQTTEHELVTSAGESDEFDIPAGTFSGLSKVQIKVKIKATSGAVTTVDSWWTVTIKDGIPTATPISPVSEVIDNTKALTFSWAHNVSTGTAQTKAELQISDDGSTWSELATVTGAETTYTVPASSFSNGIHYWRVRTYNADSVASEWSSAASFVAVGAPSSPFVYAETASPRPLIRWQSDEQQAYQVEIDGVYTSGTRFGTGKTWKAPFYLADGRYAVRVRVQNEYGFWSPWGTAALPVTNVPGGAITLTAEGGIEAVLNWTPGSFDYYLVYRDGVAIAKVTEPGYTDAASIGVVRYQVRGCYDNSDNYSLSEAVEVTVSTDKVRLYDMERGEWLHFLYDSSAHRSTGLSLFQDIQYVQLSGHTYPVAERSEFKSRALRITCVCADDAERQALRALLGHMTCCKTPEGNMTIGYPASITESSDDFFSTYSFTIEQIDRKEEIYLDS